MTNATHCILFINQWALMKTGNAVPTVQFYTKMGYVIPEHVIRISLTKLKFLTILKIFISLKISYPTAELGKLLYESNILHITSYFYEEVIYYSYILLYQKSNSGILLLLSKVIILCNLVTSYRVTLKVYIWTCMQNTNY